VFHPSRANWSLSYRNLQPHGLRRISVPALEVLSTLCPQYGQTALRPSKNALSRSTNSRAACNALFSFSAIFAF